MNKKVKKSLIYILILLLTCIISTVITLTYHSKTLGKNNNEDKMLISLVGEDKAIELENRSYKYSRTYILKDGTTIEGSGGTGNGSFVIN